MMAQDIGKIGGCSMTAAVSLLAIRRPLKSLLLAQTATDYGPYIQNLPSPLHTTSVVEACTQLLVDQWHYLRANVRDAHPCPGSSAGSGDLDLVCCIQYGSLDNAAHNIQLRR